MLKKHWKIAQAMLDFHEFSVMQIQNQSIPEQEQKDMETLLNTFTEGTESQLDQNFSQDDNDVPPKKKGGETALSIIVIQKLRPEIY